MRTEFWLDGPRHPAALRRTEEGARAAELLEAMGTSRRAAARWLGVEETTITERLGKVRGKLGARSSVELGRIAAELDLLDSARHLKKPEL